MLWKGEWNYGAADVGEGKNIEKVVGGERRLQRGVCVKGFSVLQGRSV
jgi:hypothetical protein